jgi:protein-S-isoprenylcysteine O-methyltransferase Ste14
MKLAILAGRGPRIMLATLPFVVVGLLINALVPRFFRVGGPPRWLRVFSLAVLTVGLVNWVTCVALILRNVPRRKLITTGPYRLVRHPLYVGFAFLVLPWPGLLLNTWLGVAVGGVLYAWSRVFSRDEEGVLARLFGPEWERYRRSVLLPWL